jgi:cell division protein FtsX
MFAGLRQKLVGWKTIIWARTLVVLGLVAGGIVPILQLIDGSQIGFFIPPKYTPFIPLIVAAIGIVTEWLRRITTGPVGSKGEETPSPEAKAGD